MSTFANTKQLAKCATIAEITEVALNAARTFCGADGATMILRDGERCFYVDERAISPLWKGKRFPLEMCISGWVMTRGETVTIPDIYKDSRIPHDAYRPTFVQSLCMAPIGKPNSFAAIGAYWGDKLAANEDQCYVLSILAGSLEPELKRILNAHNP